MSRYFNGSAGLDEWFTLSAGAVTSDGGPITVAVYWRPEAVSSQGLIAGFNATPGIMWSIIPEADGKYYGEGDFVGSAATYAAGNWSIAVLSKATGTTTVRWHTWTGGTWTHGDEASGTVADGTGTLTSIRIGNAHGRMDGEWVCSAVWNTVLADGDIETACSPTSLASWLVGNPAGLWAGNQATTADPVNDLTGNGANQTSVTGTPPVDADEPPGWSYSLAVPLQLYAEPTRRRVRWAT